MWTFSMMSLAFFGPMPWMYWSAITTRLLVGMFTPAIRATACLLLPTGLRLRVKVPKSPINAHTTPTPLHGARHRCSVVTNWVGGMYGFPPGPSTSYPRLLTCIFSVWPPLSGARGAAFRPSDRLGGAPAGLPQDQLDRPGDLVDIGHSVHRAQDALVAVERDQRRGL